MSSCGFSDYLPDWQHNHTGCICVASLRYVSLYVSSDGQDEKRHSHIGCICGASLRYVSSYVSSDGQDAKRHSHIGCICGTSLHCVKSYAASGYLPEMRHNHTAHIDGFFPTVCFHVHSQITCLGASKITLTAFVQPLSTVCFQMCP